MLYLITGPPAAGKSTWVQQHAKHGDITIDYDALANALTPPSDDPHNHPHHVKAVTKAARQAAIDTALGLADRTDVYVIHSMPSRRLVAYYRQRGAQVVVVDPGRATVLRRAKEERPWWMQQAVKEWYATRADAIADQVAADSSPDSVAMPW